MRDQSVLLMVVCLAVAPASAAERGGQSATGSYEVLICEGACAAAGDQNVLVKGRVVLFDDETEQQALTQLGLSARYLSEALPNACFALERLPGRNYHGYAGIRTAGLTTWAIESDELHLSLYRSADAGYKVTLRRAPHGFSGTGQSWGAGAAAPQRATSEHVVLRRTGSANVNQCPREQR